MRGRSATAIPILLAAAALGLPPGGWRRRSRGGGADNCRDGGGGRLHSGDVTETEFKIGLSEMSFAPGTYTFVVENAGATNHALEVEGSGLEEETEAIPPVRRQAPPSRWRQAPTSSTARSVTTRNRGWGDPRSRRVGARPGVVGGHDYLALSRAQRDSEAAESDPPPVDPFQHPEWLWTRAALIRGESRNEIDMV